MHNKVLIADDRVITGSYNLSNSAIVNAENVVMVRDAELAEQYGTYIDRLANRYRAA
jgi:phosphatidylserine/phosphatidylglycerophosphate/cardiolipin synthase-like enzyme